MSDQTTGMKKEVLKYDERGAAGYRPDDIDDIIASML